MDREELVERIAGEAEPSAPERGSPEWIAAWKCAGCGVVMADLRRTCDCTTSCVGRGGHGFAETAIKIDPPEDDLTDAISDALQDSIDMDWTPSVGARAVAQMLAEHGIVSLERRR